ncbi:Retrovirus-related Pol polyprotein, partial [Mucuna pruriens]
MCMLGPSRWNSVTPWNSVTARTKIDVQFNIFEAMSTLPKTTPSLASISEDMEASARSTDSINYLKGDCKEVQDLPNSEDNHDDIVNLEFEVELTELLDQVCNQEHSELCLLGQGTITPGYHCQQSPPRARRQVLRQHKRAIGWKLSDLPSINPSICMQRILMEEEIKPIRQQQRRLNPTILDMVKKEVTKLLAASIIYPISNSQWVSPMQVVPKKSGMIVMKNQQDELVPTRIQNSWRVCIDYRRLNQATRKDHFPLPFIDQVLEKTSMEIPLLFSRWFLRLYANTHCTRRLA